MNRYVVIDDEGYISNVILWDGQTPLTVDGGVRLELESLTTATYRHSPDSSE